MSDVTLPGGSDKGKPLSEVSEKNLRWWGVNAKTDDVRDACRAELERRGASDPGPPPDDTGPAGPQRLAVQSAAPPARNSSQVVSGSFRDAPSATSALADASQRAHLVAPATVCATLPEGCEVSLSAVMVDVATETYNLSGKRGLGKPALDRIAAAAGVSWDPVHSGRIDDGSDPRYCHYRAVGTVPEFDGRLRTICGEVEIDAREGSPQIEEIRFKAKTAKDDRGNPKPRDPEPQIRELRKFLLRHAESKAKLRAIRSLGIRACYTEDELKKPFVIARLMFTGASEDPEARRYYRGRIADAMLGAAAKLYAPPTAPSLPAPAGHRPPAVGAVGAEDFVDITEREYGGDY